MFLRAQRGASTAAIRTMITAIGTKRAALLNPGVYYFHFDTGGFATLVSSSKSLINPPNHSINMMSLKQYSRGKATRTASFTRYSGNGLGIEKFCK